MLPPLIQRPLIQRPLVLRSLVQRSRGTAPPYSRERGVTMALVALAMVAIISMAALSIDIGTLYQARAEAQRAADAAALAAARTVSMSGLTGDPANGAGSGTASWSEICGGRSSPASQAAIAIGVQNTVGGVSPEVTVTYSAGSAAAGSGGDTCVGISGFGVNPVVTVKVQQPNLPTFFAHIFGLFNSNWSTASVSATASAEAFNSSNAGSYAVKPRCVKPWVVPNYDPMNPSGCTAPSGASPCQPLVNTTTGAITNPGILADGGGVIGETFWLVADCQTTGSPNACTLIGGNPPQPNYGAAGVGPPNLQYVPAEIAPSASASTAVPACSSWNVSGNYAQAIAGCDQSTQYQCGSSGANGVDLSENPIHPPGEDTQNGAQCLIHEDPGSLLGQDILAGPIAGTYPFQIQAGTNNPMVLATGGLTANTLITSSTSIVSLPIYDSSLGTIFNPGATTPVTIVGFLQVFINQVDGSGNVQVTVMNVTGCAPSPGTTFNGTSSVPVRLITAP